MSDTENNYTDVIVVGAGLAGLVAAREIKKSGKSVRLVEAHDYVGGRIKSITYPNGAYIDLGGQWVGSSQKEVTKLCEEFNLHTYITYLEGDEFETIAGFAMRYPASPPPVEEVDTELPSVPMRLFYRLTYWGNRFFTTAVKEGGISSAINDALSARENRKAVDQNNADYTRAKQLLQNLADDIDPKAPWSHPKAAEFDRQTFADWVEANAETDWCKALMRLFVLSTLSCEPREVSLLHILGYIQAGQGFEVLFESEEGGAEDTLIAGGAQQICTGLADAIGWEHISLRSPVTLIKQDDNGVTVITEKDRFTAQRVIVAMPPNITGRINYAPPLPKARQLLTSKYKMGRVIKTMIMYDSPFWRAENINGQIMDIDGLIQLTLDNTPITSDVGMLQTLIMGDSVPEVLAMSYEERKKLILNHLEKYIGEGAQSPIDYIEAKWTEIPTVQGGFTGYMEPDALAKYGSALREPIGRIHWSGTEVSVEWCGFMEGAIIAGQKSAKEVLDQLDG